MRYVEKPVDESLLMGFLLAWFHEDWRLDDVNASAVIGRYKRSSSSKERAELVSDIDQVLHEYQDDAELRAMVGSHLANIEPAIESPVEWLRWLRQSIVAPEPDPAQQPREPKEGPRRRVSPRAPRVGLDSHGTLPWPWWHVDERPELLLALEQELAREIAPGHVLHGAKLRAVARCGGCDEVLVRVEGTGWAVVHTSWTGHAEQNPWPITEVFTSEAEALAAVDEHARHDHQ